MKKLLFLMLLFPIIACSQSRVFDTVYVKKTITLDSTAIPSTPSSTKGKIFGRGSGGVFYKFPDGSVVRLDSTSTSGIVSDSATYALFADSVMHIPSVISIDSVTADYAKVTYFTVDTIYHSGNDSLVIVLDNASDDYISIQNGTIDFGVEGADEVYIGDNLLAPSVDSTTDLGYPTYRWKRGFFADSIYSPKLGGVADSAKVAGGVSGKVAYTDTVAMVATHTWTDSALTARGVGVGDITSVTVTNPLSGTATSGAVTLVLDTSNATYGLTNLRVNGLNQLDTDTNTVDATRYWVLNSAGVLTAITVGNGLTGGGSTGDVIVGVDSAVLATQYDLSTATSSAFADSADTAYMALNIKDTIYSKNIRGKGELNVYGDTLEYNGIQLTGDADSTLGFVSKGAFEIYINDDALYPAITAGSDLGKPANEFDSLFVNFVKGLADTTIKADTAQRAYWATNIRGNYIKPADTTTQRTFSNSRYAQDTLNLIAGEGIEGGGELSADRTFAIDTSSDRVATNYEITVLDSNNVTNYGLSIVDIDSQYTVRTAGDSGKIAIWSDTDTIDASNMAWSLLDTSNTLSYATKYYASNADNIASGTLNSARLATSGVSAGSYTNMNATIDSYGRVTSATNGTAGSGGGGGFSNSFIDAFTTTATRDTVSITGATSYDFYMATPIMQAIDDTLNTGDELRVFADSGRAIVLRGADGYSGAWYSLGRQQMDLAQPTGATATALSGDSIVVNWTDPVSSQSANARTVDSIVVTWTATAGVPDTFYANTTNRRFVDTGVLTDTIPGLAVTTLYQITLFSYTTRDETDTATCFTSATTEEVAEPPAGTEPFKADSIGGGSLRLWIAGRFIAGKSDGDSIANGDILDSSGTNYHPTYAGGAPGILHYVDSMAVGDSGNMAGIWFNATGDTTTSICADSVATFFTGAGDKPFTAVMVLSIKDTSGTGGLDPTSNQTFFSLADSVYTWNVTDNAYSGVFDDQTPIWMKSSRYDADANSATIGHNVASGNYYNQVHIYEYIFDGDSIHLYLDGDSVHSGIMNYDALTFKTFSIGANRITTTSGGTNYCAMVLGEFCIWSTELSEADRAYYRAKLKSLYGTP